MKRLFLYFVIMTIIFGCGRRLMTEKLLEVDSLIAVGKNDSAYMLLSGIKEQYLINEEDRAHYYLLMTRACILTGNNVPPDSCIDSAILYYKQKKDCRNLADAYYYKAYNFFNQQDYPTTMLLLKEAEKQAAYSYDVRQQFKIAELITTLNETNGNNNLYLKYARLSLKLAIQLKDNNSIAYSYYSLSHAFMKNEQEDSASYYIKKTIPYLKSIWQEDMPYFLTNIGYAYKYSEPEKAKKYFLRALEYRDMTHTLAHLADIYNKEGNRDEAYKLWKRAMATADNAPKDVVICNLLEYDILHGNTDNVVEKVNEIMDIKDSIQRKLANDTLKDLQLRFDHEVEKHELDQQLNRSLWVVTFLVALLIAMTINVLFKRYQYRLLWTQTQLQIDNYTAQIRHLKESGTGVKEKVEELQAKIDAIMEDNSRKVNRGFKLYNDIKNNETIITWTKEDYNMFIDYYDTIDHATVKQLRKKYKKITSRNLAFLLLYEMGKGDEDVRHIMALSPEGLRSIRFRVNHGNEKK